MNGWYIRHLGVDELTARLEDFTGRPGLQDAVQITADKIQTLDDFWPLVSFLFEEPVEDEAAFRRVIGADGGIDRLTRAREALAGAEPFTVSAVEDALRGVVERMEAKPGQVFQPVRVAIAGGTVSPGIFESVALLGRQSTLERIDRALARAADSSPEPS
jgi:glutamyl-tRNA synthetase